MQRDTVHVRYPDGKSRSVCLAVPLHRIRAAVARNLARLHAPGSFGSPPIEIQDAYHDMGDLYARTLVRRALAAKTRGW